MAAGSNMSWLIFALMTVATWGVYGLLLHSGQTAMADPVNGRYKAFLFVGIAYFLIAVLAPIAILIRAGTDWNFSGSGMTLSLLAGTAGAIGAFCVLLAFGAGGSPAVVMSIIFAGAPVINAIIALLIHPPTGGFGALRWQFVLGIVLAALGGCLVTLYKPPPSAHSPPGLDTVSRNDSEARSAH